MPDLFFPSYTKKILSALNAAGYEAYLVGGAVRDLLLGKSPDDYDITTNALPEQVLAVCKQNGWKTVDQLGHNFGCVVIVIDGVATEVTTFRGERYNDDDMHRPAATWFCSSLREDLSRRDFTVNAMAFFIDTEVACMYSAYIRSHISQIFAIRCLIKLLHPISEYFLIFFFKYFTVFAQLLCAIFVI